MIKIYVHTYRYVLPYVLLTLKRRHVKIYFDRWGHTAIAALGKKEHGFGVDDTAQIRTLLWYLYKVKLDD